VVRFRDVTPEIAESLIEPWWDEPGLTPAGAENEEDREWDWVDLAKLCLTVNLPDCIGLETSDDRQLQGAMLLDEAAPSRLEPGKDSLHVQRVATAPRNRKEVAATNEPLFRSVGENLLCYAVLCSYALGYEGRVILTALPKAIGFYEHLKFKSTGHKDSEDLLEFELPAAEGVKMLRKFRFL